MAPNKIAATSLIIFTVGTVLLSFSGISEAGRRKSPECVVVQLDSTKKGLPDRGWRPPEFNTDGPIDIPGYDCIPREEATLEKGWSCEFFYKGTDLKCKAFQSGHTLSEVVR